MQKCLKCLVRISWSRKVQTFYESYFSNPAPKTNVFTASKMSDNSETNSAENKLTPPSQVLGMKNLDRDAFKKEVDVPTVSVPVNQLKEAVKILKPCFLKLPKLQPVQDEGEVKKILLHPHLIDESQTFLQKAISKLGLAEVSWTKLELTYDNWSCDHIFKAVLPPDSTGNVSSFSIVGHIIHLNLKQDLMEYKHIIGQVLLDKYVTIKTVVNKTHTIENEFRNLNLELLAGEPEYEVLVKEHGCQFKFDFSKVFWNPRLNNEHNEVVKMVNSDDVVYDIFAGVGPFAVPLAKKKCRVHANDLNPDSYHWLCHNATLNKVTHCLHPYNLDGKDFIQTVIKNGLVELWNRDEVSCAVHIIMNLPASALEFLESFRGLLFEDVVKNINELPTVYCYFFKRKDENAEEIIQKYLDDEMQKTLQLSQVRLVAPNKFMMRATFKLPKSVLFSKVVGPSEPPTKKLKTE